MGLDRCASTLQGVPTNYHIDSILPIVKAAAEVCGQKYEYACAPLMTSKVWRPGPYQGSRREGGMRP